MANHINIVLTNHFITRYHERVGIARIHAQKAWIRHSLKHNKLKSISGDKYRLKMRGAPFETILSWDRHNTLIALTIKPITSMERSVSHGGNE